MKEYQYIVKKFPTGTFYTAQYRRVYFLFRGRWKNLTPQWQPTYEDAEALVRKHYIKNL